jgi:hypothetical protein
MSMYPKKMGNAEIMNRAIRNPEILHDTHDTHARDKITMVTHDYGVRGGIPPQGGQSCLRVRMRV